MCGFTMCDGWGILVVSEPELRYFSFGRHMSSSGNYTKHLREGYMRSSGDAWAEVERRGGVGYRARPKTKAFYGDFSRSD